MRSKFAQVVRDRTPKETHIFVDKYTDLIILVKDLLQEKGMSQKDLADKLGKKPSEINKWLGGNHNLTLRSICKLEAELDETLLNVSKRPPFVEKTRSRLSHQSRVFARPKVDISTFITANTKKQNLPGNVKKAA